MRRVLSNKLIPNQKKNVFCRIHDALLTRLSNDDDLEKSLSTFASEMATSAMILGTIFSHLRREILTITPTGLATERSLILVDELGRGTSPREGVGISHAIAEGLLEQKVQSMLFPRTRVLITILSHSASCFSLRKCENS